MSLQLNPVISKTSVPSNVDFREGCLLMVDKPLEWTSFDVVNKIRFTLKYSLGVKKIKVGHAGTLDPLASGLLLICIGKFTKRLKELQGLDKTYTGTISLGYTTPTYDAESEPDATHPVDHITDDLILETANSMLGKLMQTPPIYSAVKVKGQSAYSLARRGKHLVLEPRPVEIKKFEIRKIEGNNIDFLVLCSKGTYIRSLANDFGKALGSGAYLSALRRTQVGEYDVKDAYGIEDITEIIDMLANRNVVDDN